MSPQYHTQNRIAAMIHQRLQELGVSARSASKEVDPDNPDLIRNILRAAKNNPNYSPGAKSLALVAKALGKDLLFFLEHQSGLPMQENVENINVKSGHKSGMGTITYLPIKGFVQAGVWQEVDGMNQAESDFYSASPDVRFPVTGQFILNVRGDSMNAAKPFAIPDGAKLKCIHFADYGSDLKTGQIAVIHRFKADGGLVEATVKRVHKFPDRIEFHPESTNPKHKAYIWKDGDGNEFEEIRVIAIVLDIILSVE